MRNTTSIVIEDVENFKVNLLSWAQQFNEVVWFDSNSDFGNFNQDYSRYDVVLAVEANSILNCNYENAFEKLKAFQSNINDYIFGYLGYDLKNDIEILHSDHLNNLGFSDLYFFQPKKLFFLKDKTLEISYLKNHKNEIESDLEEIFRWKHPERPLREHEINISKRISKSQYFQKLDTILEHIHRGDIYEVNFCQEFYAENTIIDPLSVYQKLNDISSPPFATFLKIDDQFLLSASPERFVKKQENQIISQPIKGTIKRGKNKQTDNKLKHQLENDLKERTENIMIVDLVRNDLSKTAIKGTVQVEELCKVYTFKQVHQLISTVISEVRSETNPVDIIKSLFPMGSMTGAPKISAMKIIEELEDAKRGLYSGAVGYFTPDNDFDFNVVIRSILYNQTNKYVSFSVGGAITSKSIIEKEYDECLVKAKAMKKALKC